MKKVILSLFIIILLIALALPLRANAVDEQEAKSQYTEQLDDILSDSDIEIGSDEISSMTFGGFAKAIAAKVTESDISPFKLLGTILLVTVISVLLKNTGSIAFRSTADIYSMVCILTAVTVISPPLFNAFSQAANAVSVSGGFISVFIPVFSGATAASGHITSAAVYDVAVLAASELIVQLISGFLMPVLSAAVMLSVTGSVFSKNDMSGVVQLLKKVITWTMTITMTVFIGFITLKCSLAGKTDGAATKAARFVISGSVPVVGGAVSDAYAAVRSSFDLIRGTVGTVGCISVLLIMFPPVIKLLLFRFVMWTGAAAAELFGAEHMKRLLGSFDSALAIAQSVLVCYGVMFVLCTGILMQTAGG
ncbi:MAG: hypothetical protein J6X56_05040 [Ruminococcus sp.]|nr:hypothetical protein [Ruminococcus sp.]